MFAIAFAIQFTAFAETKTIDRRNASAESRYRIVFAARGGTLTGHAFVAWCVEDSTKRMSIQDAFGFYPESGKGVLGEVPGKIVDEFQGGGVRSASDQLIVCVGEEAFRKADAIRKKWVGKKYSVAENDCVSFVQEVALSLGLNTPDRNLDTLKPQDFISALIKNNR